MNKIKSILAFVALMLCGGAWAEVPTANYTALFNNNMTLSNNTGGTVNWKEGASSPSYELVRGSTDNYAVKMSTTVWPTIDNFSYNGDFSYLTVAKLATSGIQVIGSVSDAVWRGSTKGLSLIFHDNKVKLVNWNHGSQNQNVEITAQMVVATYDVDENWLKQYHSFLVVCTGNGTKAKLFIDGKLIGNEVTLPNRPGYTAWSIGRLYGGTGMLHFGSDTSAQVNHSTGMLVDAALCWKSDVSASAAEISEAYPVWPRKLSATIGTNTDFSAITWNESYAEQSTVVVTLESGAILTIDKTVDLTGDVVINGSGTIKVGDALFEDGCYVKSILSGTSLTIADTVTLDQTMKSGFYGAVSKSETSIDLRAQNKEVISINIAGGKITANGTHQPQDTDSNKFVPDTDELYGLAPVPGSSWNNIGKRWKNYRNTVTLKGAKAWDGASQTTRETMDLSATASTTWEADIQNPFLKGYLDDGGGVEVSVTGIPYEKYDVIVYATSDDANFRLAPVTVNNVKYTCRNGEAVVDTGTTDWGVGLQATPAFGKNAMIIRNQSLQTLSIKAERHTDAGRGTLCAVQVINMGGEVLTKREYAATIAAGTTAATLSELSYTGSGSEIVGGKLTRVTLTVEGESTDGELVLTADNPSITLEFIKIISARPVKVVASAALENVARLDFSEVTATATTAVAINAATIGTELVLGANCTGMITVGANQKVTIKEGASAPLIINNSGTIRNENDLSSGVVVNQGAGTYEFKNAKVTNNPGTSYVIQVQADDRVVLPTGGQSGQRGDVSYKVLGGELQIGPDDGSQAIWYGTGNVSFEQTGGTVNVTANGTEGGNANGFLLGWNGVLSKFDFTGGEFNLPNSRLNFWSAPIAMNVSGEATVKIKGLFAGSGTTHTASLAGSGVIELGSLGWRDVPLTLNGGTLKGYEDNAAISSAITVSRTSKIAAASGTTLTVTSTITGSAALTIGDATDNGTVDFSGATMSGYTGTVSFSGSSVTLPANFGGTVNGAVAKIADDSTTTYYSTIAEAITVAGDANLSSIEILVDNPMLPDGYVIADSHVVKAQASVTTRVGERDVITYYATFAEAISHGNGHQVNVLADVELDSTLIIGGDSAYLTTLNLKGHTISHDVAGEPVIRVAANGMLGITSNEEVGTISNSAESNAISIENNGKLYLGKVALVGKVNVATAAGSEVGCAAFIENGFANDALDVEFVYSSPIPSVYVDPTVDANLTINSYCNWIGGISGYQGYFRAATGVIEGVEVEGYAYNRYTLKTFKPVLGFVLSVESSDAQVAELSNVYYATQGGTTYTYADPNSSITFKLLLENENIVPCVDINGQEFEPNENGIYTIPVGSTSFTARITTAPVVAKIGEKKYDSILRAMRAATEDSVIDLVANDGVNFELTKDITIRVAEGEKTITGIISGGHKITKTGAGTLTLSAANTYTGGTVISEGAIKAGNNSALGTSGSAGDIEVATGATLNINGKYLPSKIYLSGDGVDGNGALVNGTDLGADHAWKITLRANASWGGSGFTHFGRSSVVDLGGYTFTKKGLNNFPLNNTSGITNGKIVVEAGEFQNNNNANNLSTVELEIKNGATLNMNGGTSLTVKSFKCEGAITGTNAKLIVAENGSLYDSSANIGKLELKNNVTVVAAANKKITVTGEFACDQVVKVDASAKTEESDATLFTLPNEEGAVALAAKIRLVNDTQHAVVAKGADVCLVPAAISGESAFETAVATAGDVTLGENLTLTKTIEVADGVTLNLGGNTISGGTLNLASGTVTFHVEQGKTATVSSQITGTGNIMKTGGGTLILDANNNTQSGNLQIDSGIVQIKQANSTTSAAGYNVVLNGGKLVCETVSDAHGKLIKSVVLEKDGTIEAHASSGDSNGLIGVGINGAETSIALKGHTLTMIGRDSDKRVYFDKTSITSEGGVGTLYIEKGVAFIHCKQMSTDGNVSLKFGANASLQAAKDTSFVGDRNINVYDLVYNGTAPSDEPCTITVCHNASGSGTIKNLVLSDGATLSVVSGSAPTVNGTLTLGASLKVNVKGVSGGEATVWTVPVGTNFASTTISNVDDQGAADNTWILKASGNALKAYRNAEVGGYLSNLSDSYQTFMASSSAMTIEDFAKNYTLAANFTGDNISATDKTGTMIDARIENGVFKAQFQILNNEMKWRNIEVQIVQADGLYKAQIKNGTTGYEDQTGAADKFGKTGTTTRNNYALASFTATPGAMTENFVFDGTIENGAVKSPTGWLTSFYYAYSAENTAIGPVAGTVVCKTTSAGPYGDIAFGSKNSFTVSFYANALDVDSASKQAMLLCLGSGSAGVFLKKTTDGKIAMDLYNSSSEDYASDDTENSNGFHLFTITRDAGKVYNLYVDGKKINAKYKNYSPATGFQIAAPYANNSSFANGIGLAVSRLLGYDRTLSDYQIAELAKHYPAVPMSKADGVSTPIRGVNASKLVEAYNASKPNGAELATSINSDGVNCLPLWMSAILGLDPTDEDSTTVVIKGAQTTETGSMKLLTGIKPNPEIMTVTLKSGTTAACEDTDSTTMDNDGSFTVTLPTGDDKVKYYKLTYEFPSAQ